MHKAFFVFVDDNLYDFDVAFAYTAKSQETVINNGYIHPPEDYFEAGRLAPKGDFFYPSWQVQIWQNVYKTYIQNSKY